MSLGQDLQQHTQRWQKYLVQRRVNSRVDQYRPHRWNWQLLVRPLDRSVERQAEGSVEPETVRSLRYFWLDGLFASISENFYVGFITLYLLAYGATNGQVGLLTSMANLLGALALFPGARLIDTIGSRKKVVVWSGGWAGRLVLLAMAVVPFLIGQPLVAIMAIIVLNGLRSFTGTLANPGWTAMVADLVPNAMRGRFFGSRNMAMGIVALIVAPLAGRVINFGNELDGAGVFGYQLIFFLAFAFGMVSTISFQRISEPPIAHSTAADESKRGLWRGLLRNRTFLGLVISALIWNLALQIAAPFFNVYLVDVLGATTAMVGILASVSSLFALFGQQLFGRLMDKRGAFWVQTVSGLLIPVLPVFWMLATTPWHVALINSYGGFVWAGYNLANFNLLLSLTPDDERPRAVAIYQMAVFGSSVIGPVMGGYLADLFSYKLIFGLSAIGRVAGMAAFLWLTVRVYRQVDGNDTDSLCPQRSCENIVVGRRATRSPG